VLLLHLTSFQLTLWLVPVLLALPVLLPVVLLLPSSPLTQTHQSLVAV
jgi:hypothetical protein